ncbi:MAG: glycosyltransferase family 2 protein [Chitinophagales bacterium]|nr:glycosyltransferase family 2 protein [Chitinophagales bacterium]
MDEPVQYLTISIPAYNDSRSLMKLVEEAQQLCKRLAISFQILIINDGSSDNTLLVAEQLACKFNNVQIINHEINLGFGETLKQVFMVPKTEWALFLPGDNQFPVSNLIRFLEIKDEYDFILGFRKERKDRTYRKLYSLVYNRVISLISGCKVRDVNSIVFYRTKIFDTIELRSVSAFVHAEFFIRASAAGFRIKEIEVAHIKREFGFGAGGNVKVIATTVKELFLYLVKGDLR